LATLLSSISNFKYSLKNFFTQSNHKTFQSQNEPNNHQIAHHHKLQPGNFSKSFQKNHLPFFSVDQEGFPDSPPHEEKSLYIQIAHNIQNSADVFGFSFANLTIRFELGISLLFHPSITFFISQIGLTVSEAMFIIFLYQSSRFLYTGESGFFIISLSFFRVALSVSFKLSHSTVSTS
jgi:hypothetical protein